MSDKPLFIPLKREYFEAFKSGEKNCEYRPYGKRWNEKTCRVGRSVVLSLGYGKANRLKGTVSLVGIELNPRCLPGWTACYGNKHKEACCIYIDLDPV